MSTEFSDLPEGAIGFGELKRGMVCHHHYRLSGEEEWRPPNGAPIIFKTVDSSSSRYFFKGTINDGQTTHTIPDTQGVEHIFVPVPLASIPEKPHTRVKYSRNQYCSREVAKRRRISHGERGSLLR